MASDSVTHANIRLHLVFRNAVGNKQWRGWSGRNLCEINKISSILYLLTSKIGGGEIDMLCFSSHISLYPIVVYEAQSVNKKENAQTNNRILNA